jgi:hypothetical protein
VTHRISVEDGALLKGSVQVRAEEKKNNKNESKASVVEAPKAASAAAGNA